MHYAVTTTIIPIIKSNKPDLSLLAFYVLINNVTFFFSAKTSHSVHFSPVKTKIITEASTDAASKQLQSQLPRVDIGEGLSLFEKPKLGPEMSEELIVPDLARYSHAHHPRPGRQPQYHWNHESAFASAASETWSNKHWPSSVTAKVPNKIHSSLRNVEASKEDGDDVQGKTRGNHKLRQ